MENETVLYECPICGEPSVVAPPAIDSWQIVAACPNRDRPTLPAHNLVKYMGEKCQRLTEENRRLHDRLCAGVEGLTSLMVCIVTSMGTVQSEFSKVWKQLESIAVSDPATPEDLEGRMSDRSIPPYQIGQGRK